jgi:epoxyqueuosine reductase
LQITSEHIKEKALELGFYNCGIAKAQLLEEDSEYLKQWLDKGNHGTMSYMDNHFLKRVDPTKLMENAKSVISVLYNYYPKDNIPEEDNYKISKYAYGTDYHFIIKHKLKALIKFIEINSSEVSARAFVDSAPVLDRAWAARAGLGWIGKNTNLITKEQGSWFFIGEIITDLELDYENQTVPNHCGGCTRCIEACPTNALEPYKLDARKCISYWTIEHKGETIPDKYKGQFENYMFGCDICQDVCPWNRLSEPNNEPEFEPKEELLKMRKSDWKNLNREQFNLLFKNSPVKRTKFEGFVRNVKFLNE